MRRSQRTYPQRGVSSNFLGHELAPSFNRQLGQNWRQLKNEEIASLGGEPTVLFVQTIRSTSNATAADARFMKHFEDLADAKEEKSGPRSVFCCGVVEK